MPLEKTTCTPCDECHGHQWLIRNEAILAELVAKLLMGQYRHVQKILANEKIQSTPTSSAASIEDLIRKLEPQNEQARYHRDGWIFQMITWVAAKLIEPEIMSAPPQSQSAMPGLDNLFIRTNGNKVSQVVIGEDKATINDRSTITSQVWPELRDFETGRRDHELLNEITPILERNSETLDVDECLKELFWEEIRAYRVCITTKEPKDDMSRKELFKNFDAVAPGHIDKRRGETFVIESLRPWMDKISQEIIKLLRAM